MAIFVGTDIVEIGRIKKIIEKDENFKLKIFTKNEINYCEKKNAKKYESYAVRFAAKEAIYKALSDRVQNLSWKDFEILNQENGRPYVNDLLGIEGLEQIDISLSHSNENAIAYVVAEVK